MSEMNADGFWTGRLSSSALGVAVALAALHFHDAKEHRDEIQKGLNWLKANINTDGSFGDTPESPGNISTSLLVYAALNLYSGKDVSVLELQEKTAEYLQAYGIDISSGEVAEAILAHYKTDFTFSVPILTMCALCGIPGKEAFDKIPQLPFELALMPQKFYRLLNLSVVSYAIPALIAVGIVIFKNKKSEEIARWIRGRAEQKALLILQKVMPESGGFLEAIPLTAFVALSLINAGYKNMDVVGKGIAFLKRTQREDGGWPIDVDLSTWVTSQSVKALRGRIEFVLSPVQKDRLTLHLKAIQNKAVHPFNGTPPGGWGWTSYSGSVPDCDDTPGTILALLRINPPEKVKEEVLAGAGWLLKLQNSDGGFPTFSKGWGKLPFDQSCSDLTGHCLLALTMVNGNYRDINVQEQNKLINAISRSVRYLHNRQKEDGSWLPLWFGNQYANNHENPVYGTARVLNYLKDARPLLKEWKQISSDLDVMIGQGTKYLLDVQNPDGSWGGSKNIQGTMEETALATAALAGSDHQDACFKGFSWLDDSFQKNGLPTAPIGLYFASLWYDEKMYPLTAYLEAVTKFLDE